MILRALCGALLAAVALIHVAARPSQLSPLPPHPRLMLTPARRAELLQYVSVNVQAQAFYTGTLDAATYLIHNTSVLPVPGPGKTGDARYVLQRMYDLALMYQLTGEQMYMERAQAELLALAAWPCLDVNGTVQLNTGESLHAFAIGFDWLYPALNDSVRASVVDAMVQKGLSMVALAYAASPPAWADAFVNTTSNWNAVINGGTIIACLAIADEPGTPAWVMEELFPAALRTLMQSVHGFLPDGGWQEGPNYCGYTTRYLVPTVFSMLSALGDDAGILSAPGVSGIADFAVNCWSPSLDDWDWADSHITPETRSQYLRLADTFNATGVAYVLRNNIESVFVPPNSSEVVAMNYATALLHFTDIGTESDAADLPLSSVFHAQHVVMSRSSWVQPNATYFSFKGSNVSWAWAHNHLDAGSFVYQLAGAWFAEDLGNDNYAIPQYFSPQRYTLYRTSSVGHNTLTFDNKSHACEVTGIYSSNCPVSPLALFNNSAPGLHPSTRLFGIVDTSAAWQHVGVASARRGFVALTGLEQLFIMDEVTLNASAPTLPDQIQWRLHTTASVQLLDSSVLLTAPGCNRTVTLMLTSQSQCPGATWSAAPVTLAPPQYPAVNTTLLWLTAPAHACAVIVVAIRASDVQPQNVTLQPLADWATTGPYAT